MTERKTCFVVRREGNPPSSETRIECNTARSAAVRLARELWDQEEWDGEELIRIRVHGNGTAAIYEIAASLELQLSITGCDLIDPDVYRPKEDNRPKPPVIVTSRIKGLEKVRLL